MNCDKIIKAIESQIADSHRITPDMFKDENRILISDDGIKIISQKDYYIQ